MQVAGTPLEFGTHLFDAVLVAGQGRGHGVHGEGRGAAGGLGLELAHVANQLLGPRHVADAPSGHGVALGHGVEGEGPLTGVGRGGREAPVGPAAVEEPIVDLVADDDHVIPFGQDLRQRVRLLRRIDGPTGIAGRIEDERRGPGRQRVPKLLRGDLEVGIDVGAHEDGNAAGDLHLFRVRHPVGSGDDDLVSRVQNGGEGEPQALLAAHRDQNPGGRVLQGVLPAKLLGRRSLGLGDSRCGLGVLGFSRLDAIQRVFPDVGGSGKIGFSRAQAHHVDAGPAKLGGPVADRNGRRLLELQEPL